MIEAEQPSDWAAEGHGGTGPITASWDGLAEHQVAASLPFIVWRDGRPFLVEPPPPPRRPAPNQPTRATLVAYLTQLREQEGEKALLAWCMR
jgi:hypothetical protein